MRITFRRQQRYYPIGFDLTKYDFTHLNSSPAVLQTFNIKVRKWYNDMKLKTQGKVWNANNYECSQNSLKTQYPKLSFRDIDSELLNANERKLLSDSKSISTVGIYLRSLWLFSMRQ